MSISSAVGLLMTGSIEDEFAGLNAALQSAKDGLDDADADDDWDIRPSTEPKPVVAPALTIGTRYILHDAVACNGTARGFDQGDGTTTCAVYAADWLAHQILGDNGFFTRATASKTWTRPIAPADNYHGQLVPVDGKIAVVIDDSTPTSEYHDEAQATKTEWGSTGSIILTGQLIRINRKIVAKRRSAGSGPSISLFPAADRDDLLQFVTTPEQYHLIATQFGTGHAVASHTTASHFSFFDPKVGELSLPLGQVDRWLDKEHTKTYFTAMKTLTATRLTFR